MNIQLQELIDAITENTKALRDVLAASGTAAPEVEAPKKAPKKAKLEVVTPEPEPVITESEMESFPTTDEELTPTPTPAPAAKADDTPHVPAPTTPGQPEAGEYVDVDEVISKIQKTVKDKMMSGDTESVKKTWETIRKGYGIDRIAELRNEPAKLLEALAKAQSL